MENLLSHFSLFLDKLTLRKVVLLALTTLILVVGYISYAHSKIISDKLFGSKITAIKNISNVSPESKELIDLFMKKYRTKLLYLEVHRLEFKQNLRIPIYMKFNDRNLESLVYERLSGNEGTLPIFISDDTSSNNQMISVIQGEMSCDKFSNSGLSRNWPDLKSILVTTCSLGLPPAFGPDGIGYMSIHTSLPLSSFQLQSITIDFKLLSEQIYRIESSK
jgi:hypothetical protein